MKISIPTNHNYYEENGLSEDRLITEFHAKKVDLKKLKSLFSSLHEITIGDNSLDRVNVLHFKKVFADDDNRLVLKLYSKTKGGETKYFIQTGLYAGVITYRNINFHITPHCGDVMMNRMLNFANDFYLDQQTRHMVSFTKSTDDIFLLMVALLFIRALEKAIILGLPQHYQIKSDRTHKVRGKIDINNFIKKDIPFLGKVSVQFKERRYIQEIIDVLYRTLTIIEQHFNNNKPIHPFYQEIRRDLSGFRQTLKQEYSGKAINTETIVTAKNHSALNNPLYQDFKHILNYAEIIINYHTINSSGNSSEHSGYLVDISQLFEIYLEKLLTKRFTEWHISGQKQLNIYQEQFYKRSLFPDLIMIHKQNDAVVVLDAKFKAMKGYNSDVDRMDLHQMHSYAGFYQDRLVLCGLIYPLMNKINTNKYHAQGLYGLPNRSHFIIDGILHTNVCNTADLIKHEQELLDRLQTLMNK